MSEGLKKRYHVRRVDKKEDPNADYFVMRLDEGDKHAMTALEAYAKSVEGERPVLAQDLRDKVKKYKRGSTINLE
jgi:hypothetical protein